MNNDAIRILDIMEGLDKIRKKHTPAHKEFEVVNNSCLYCEFGRFDALSPNPFWQETLSFLAENVDVLAVKSDLGAESDSSELCQRYFGTRFLRTLAEHLTPITITC